MSQKSRLTSVLRTGGFCLHALVGRSLRVGFGAQCWILVSICTVFLLIAATLDGSLSLPGRDIGLLEHPTIWAYVALQVALPLSMSQTVGKMLRARVWLRSLHAEPTSHEFRVARYVTRFLRLADPLSRTVATIAYSIGIASFVWNTYQNQLPGILLPYNFWDSSTYLWGYWVTRVYKLYLFVWLFPYIGLAHTAFLFVTLRQVHRSRAARVLQLLPFHPDGVGGLGLLSSIISAPVVVALAILALPMAAVLVIHRATDVTPLLGATAIFAVTIGAYALPTLYLRKEIRAMKKDLVAHFRTLQQGFHSRLVAQSPPHPQTIPDANQAIDYFDKLCKRVQDISEFPHLRTVLRYAALALTPTALAQAFKVSGELRGLIRPLLAMF